MDSSATRLAEPEIAARTLLFRVGGRVYGCDIDVVREIIPSRRATRLPGAPPFVEGLINLRGTIVTVLDLGARLDPGHAPARDASLDGAGSIILVDHGTRVVGVAVDEVMDVQPIAREAVETGSDTGREGEGAEGEGRVDARAVLVRGLAHLEDGVVVLVDIETLVTHVLL